MNAARLAAFNFGIQLVWGAVLAVSLQARCIALAPRDHVTAYAMIATVGALIAAAVQVIVGRAADRRHASIGHRREFYLAGIAASMPLLFWFYLTPSFVGLAAAFCGLQVAMNVAGGPYQAAIPDHAPSDRQGETASWMSALQSVGAAAGLLVAGFVRSPSLTALLLASGLALSGMVTVLHLRGVRGVQSPSVAVPYTRTLSALLLSRGVVNFGFYTLLGFLLFFVEDRKSVV